MIDYFTQHIRESCRNKLLKKIEEYFTEDTNVSINPESLLPENLEQGKMIMDISFGWKEKKDAGKFLTEFEVIKLFYYYYELWEKETSSLLSMVDPKKIENQWYEKIIEMREKVVPLILFELNKEFNHWFVALSKITGQNLIHSKDNFFSIRRKWLQWGTRNGYDYY